MTKMHRIGVCFLMCLFNVTFFFAQAPLRTYFRENLYRDIKNMEFLAGTEALVFNSAYNNRVYSLDLKTHRLQVLENFPGNLSLLTQNKDWLLMSYSYQGGQHITIRNIKTGKKGISKDYPFNAVSDEGVMNSMLRQEVTLSPDGKYFLAARDFSDVFLYVPFERFTGLRIVNREKYSFKHRVYTKQEWDTSILPFLLRDECNHSAFNPATGAVVLRTGFKELTVFDNLDNMKPIATLNVAKNLSTELETVQRFIFSLDGSRLIGISNRGLIFLWDATDKYKLIGELKSSNLNLKKIATDEKGSRLACHFEDNIEFWDLNSKKRIGSIKSDQKIYDIAFSQKGELLAYCNQKGITIVDVPGFFVLQKITDQVPQELPADALKFAIPSRNGKYLYVGFAEGIRVINLSTLRIDVEILYKNRRNQGPVDAMEFLGGGLAVKNSELHLLSDETGRYLLIDLTRLIDLENGATEIAFEWTNPKEKATNIGTGMYRLALKCEKFSTPTFYGRAVKYLAPPPVLDNVQKLNEVKNWYEKQAGTDIKGNNYAWNENKTQLIINGQPISTPFSKNTSIQGLNTALYSPSSDGNFVWISNGNRVEYWDTRKKERLLELVQTIDGFLIVSDDGFYSGQRSISASMSFERDGRVLPSDQFDYFFNRPDLILEKLGFTESNSLLPLYRKVAQKRQQKAGILQNNLASIFAGPSIDLSNAREIPFTTTIDSVKLRIEMSDPNQQLATFQLWVNNVPIFGRKGKIISGNQLSLTIDVLLAGGVNTLEFSATNAKGIESERLSLSLLNRKDPGKSNLYIVATGCSSYKDPNFQLNYAAKDARDFGNFFSTAQHTFDSIFVLNILDAELTKENLIKIRKWFARSKPEDHVALFFAGHGVLDEALDYYLAPWDMDFTKPAARGIAFSDFEGLLDDVPARRRILLVDACHSGEIDKEDWVKNPDIPNSENVKIRGFLKGKKSSVGGQTFQIMSELFSNYSKGNGAFTLTAAAGAEFSWESGDLQNGIFTHSLLEGLRSRFADLDKNGSIDLQEWADYASGQVSKLSNRQQNPTIRNSNIYLKPVIWDYTNQLSNTLLSNNERVMKRTEQTEGSEGTKSKKTDILTENSTKLLDAKPMKLYTIVHNPDFPNNCFESIAGHWMADDVFVGKSKDFPSDNGVIEYHSSIKGNNYKDYHLYQWTEAMQYKKIEQARGVCPVGWHVPNKAEWFALDTACEKDNTCILANAFPVPNTPYWTSSTENGLPLLRVGPKQFDIGNPEDKALVKCKKNE